MHISSPAAVEHDATRGTATPNRSPRRLRTAARLALLTFVLALTACTSATSTKGPQIGATGAPTVGASSSVNDLQTQVENVIAAVQPSVVQVESSGGQGAAIGSGEIVTADGYIVTNDHVVAGFSQYQVVLSSGKTLAATLVGQAASDDLAVVKVAATGLQPIAFGDSSTVRVGQFVLAIGSPLGLNQSATFGIVSALNRTASESPEGPAGVLTGLIQTSAPINPGNSGGALVDMQAQLIGVPTLGANTNQGSAADGIGFAIASNRVKFVAQQLIANGHLVTTGQGFLGIIGEDVTPALAAANNLPIDHGVLIAGFANDASGKSPAQSAGLQQGDIITSVDGKNVTANADLASILLSLSPGTQVKVITQRGSSQETFTVTLGERPAA